MFPINVKVYLIQKTILLIDVDTKFASKALAERTRKVIFRLILYDQTAYV